MRKCTLQTTVLCIILIAVAFVGGYYVGHFVCAKQSIQKLYEQAILNGDFSTLVGTWRNGLGQEFTFDKNGLVNSGNIEKVSMGNDGSINFSVRSGATGFGMSIYPAGTTMKWVDSDLSKNRLIAGQAAPTSSEQVFYKVD